PRRRRTRLTRLAAVTWTSKRHRTNAGRLIRRGGHAAARGGLPSGALRARPGFLWPVPSVTPSPAGGQYAFLPSRRPSTRPSRPPRAARCCSSPGSCEHLATVDDKIPEPSPGHKELAHDGAYPCEADVDLDRGQERRHRCGQHDLDED